MIRFKRKRLRVLAWENVFGELKLHFVSPLAQTQEQLCAQFYRYGMRPAFRLTRLWNWRGNFCWMETIPQHRRLANERVGSESATAT